MPKHSINYSWEGSLASNHKTLLKIVLRGLRLLHTNNKASKNKTAVVGSETATRRVAEIDSPVM